MKAQGYNKINISQGYNVYVKNYINDITSKSKLNREASLDDVGGLQAKSREIAKILKKQQEKNNCLAQIKQKQLIKISKSRSHYKHTMPHSQTIDQVEHLPMIASN